MAERFARHRQPRKPQEIRKPGVLVIKGMALGATTGTLTRTGEQVRDRAMANGPALARQR